MLNILIMLVFGAASVLAYKNGNIWIAISVACIPVACAVVSSLYAAWVSNRVIKLADARLAEIDAIRSERKAQVKAIIEDGEAIRRDLEEIQSRLDEVRSEVVHTVYVDPADLDPDTVELLQAFDQYVTDLYESEKVDQEVTTVQETIRKKYVEVWSRTEDDGRATILKEVTALIKTTSWYKNWSGVNRA